MSDQFIPPWMDLETLCKHICVHENTVDNWVAHGILPPGRKRGGKLMWKWSEVDERLTVGKPDGSTQTDEERVRNGTRRALAEAQARH